MEAPAARPSPTTSPLRRALGRLRAREIGIHAFAGEARAQSALLDALPERFGQALEQILQRMESGSLFAEESCSFSQADLHRLLDQWLERADAELASLQRPT
ncbi:MAG: hypothetical protein ACK5TE_05360 [Pseudomonadota bacterium]|jgi:hypothetical protein